MSERKVERVSRVARVADGGALTEPSCWACGAEMRAGFCSQRCVLSREQEQHTADSRRDRVARNDRE